MLTNTEILSDLRIDARRRNHGNFKTTCPECSHTRKNKRDPCLSVRCDDKGVQYHCHNCGWKGGKFNDDTREAQELA